MMDNREKALVESDFVRSRACDDGITAYNFTRKAFTKKVWNRETVSARGLFVRDGHVVGRGYDKFFAIGETHGFTYDQVVDGFTLPVDVSRKENGFLGIIFADGDALRVYSKSGNTDFAGYARDMLDMTESEEEVIRAVCLSQNVSLTVEVCHEHDPHIVSMTPGVYLLDAIVNDFDMVLAPQVRDTILELVPDVFTRVPRYQVTTRDELRRVVDEAYASRQEGVVLRDADNRMVKIKSDYYRSVKALRYSIFSLLHGDESKLEKKAESMPLARFVLDHYTPEMVEECAVTTLNGNREVNIPAFMELLDVPADQPLFA